VHVRWAAAEHILGHIVWHAHIPSWAEVCAWRAAIAAALVRPASAECIVRVKTHGRLTKWRNGFNATHALLRIRVIDGGSVC